MSNIQVQIRFLTQVLEVINNYSRRETAKKIKKYNCPIRYRQLTMLILYSTIKIYRIPWKRVQTMNVKRTSGPDTGQIPLYYFIYKMTLDPETLGVGCIY